jgi:hypothetical protein
MVRISALLEERLHLLEPPHRRRIQEALQPAHRHPAPVAAESASISLAHSLSLSFALSRSLSPRPPASSCKHAAAAADLQHTSPASLVWTVGNSTSARTSTSSATRHNMVSREVGPAKIRCTPTTHPRGCASAAFAALPPAAARQAWCPCRRVCCRGRRRSSSRATRRPRASESIRGASSACTTGYVRW